MKEDTLIKLFMLLIFGAIFLVSLPFLLLEEHKKEKEELERIQKMYSN